MEVTILFSILIIGSLTAYMTEAILVASGLVKQNKNRERALRAIAYLMIAGYALYIIKLLLWHM